MRSAVLVAAAAAALAGVARAGIDANELKAIRTLLQQGQARKVLEVLDRAGARDAYIGDPKALVEVCSATASNAGRLAREGAEAKRLTDLLVEWAGTAVGTDPAKADVHWALGHAVLASGRLSRAQGAKDLAVEPWTKAAEAYEKAYEAEARNGGALAAASETLAEAAELPGADAAAMLERAGGICSRALEKHPDSVPVLRAASLLDLRRARRALAAKDKAGAEVFLEKGIARLAPRMKGSSPDLDLATAHNEIVGFVRSNPKDLKKPKADFVTSTQKLPINLQFEAPLSRYWSLGEDGDRLYQTTASFESLRTFLFADFKWDTNWRLADGSLVGGDNIKGLATNEFEVSLKGLKSVKAKKTPVKLRLNGRLDDGYYYEVEGIDRDGDWLLDRSWYFKSKAGNQTTYRVTILEYRQGAALDPVSQAVLDSIREVGRK